MQDTPLKEGEVVKFPGEPEPCKHGVGNGSTCMDCAYPKKEDWEIRFDKECLEEGQFEVDVHERIKSFLRQELKRKDIEHAAELSGLDQQITALKADLSKQQLKDKYGIK